MALFDFDPKVTPSDNIERFFKHLDTRNAAFAKLLRDNMHTMLPFSEGQQRTNDRTMFNDAIATALESPAAPSKG